MSIKTLTTLPFHPVKSFFLLFLFLLGIYFLGYELEYALTRDRDGESSIRTVALIIHLIFATPLLLMPVVQFSQRFRNTWPVWHRRLGKAYLSFAIVASSLAIYLGITFESLGRRVPVTIFACVWLFFSISAWICARQRRFAEHQKFVVRTYAMALAFVFVRVMGEFEASLFAFIPSDELRGVTREWLCFVLPLLAVEAWFNWRHEVNPVKRRPLRADN